MTTPKNVIIIGAGPAGLAAALETTRMEHFSAEILEQHDIIGGISRTEQYKGYLIDIGGHRFFSKNQTINELWQDLLGADFLTVRRISRIYYRGKFFSYPLQFWNTIRHLGPLESMMVSLSYLKAILFPLTEEQTFDQWVTNRFGRRLYRMFFKEYTEKVWGMPCTSIQADWAAQRIKGLSFAKAVSNAVIGSNGAKTLVERFNYPRRGPGMMWDRLLDRILESGGRIALETRVSALHHANGVIKSLTVRNVDGESVRQVDQLITSMPINRLVQLLRPAAPRHVLACADRLHYRDFLIVTLIVNRPDLFPDQWLYIHCPEVSVGRIQNFRNWSRELVPDQNTSCLGMEYFCSRDDHLWSMPDDDLVNLAKRELETVGLAKATEIIDGHVIRQPYAYPIYDDAYQDNLATIKDYLSSFRNLQTIGRNGMHRYNNMDHSMLTGMLAAKNLAGARHDIWRINEEAEYLEENSDDEMRN